MNESEYGKYVALDAEMTRTIAPGGGFIPEPTQIAITDIKGKVLFNEYFHLTHPPIMPMRIVREEKLKANATRTYDDAARNDVLSILRGKIVVGHDLIHDFKALRINPTEDGLAGVIDSAKLPIFKKFDPLHLPSRTLKNLTSEFLHRRIQAVGDIHNAFEDAKASANLIRTTFPYLNAPMPVTRDMVTASKVIADYGRRLGLNAELPMARKPRLNPGAAEFVGAAPAPAPAPASAPAPARTPAPAPARAGVRAPAPVPTSADVNALMLAARRIVQAHASGSAAASANMPNLLQFEQPVKSAENYLKEMEGLNIRTVQGRNSRKRVNRRKTRRLRR